MQKEAAPTSDLTRTQAMALLSLAVFAVLWASRHYLLGGASYGDDNSSHLAVSLHIARLFQFGHTDLFFDQANLGVPLFLSYQFVPAMWMAFLFSTFGHLYDPITLYKLSIVVMWGLMPLSWYRGMRWFGCDRWTAVAAGLLVLGLQDQHAYGVCLTNTLHKGLYAQLYGMLLLPLALGSLYRHLFRRHPSRFLPIFFFALIFASHIFFGLLTGMASFLFVAVAPSPSRQVRTWRRLFAIYLGTFLLLAFWIVPILQHKAQVGGLPWKTYIHNGPLLSDLLRALTTGPLFDAQRAFPWFTLLLAAALLFALLTKAQAPQQRHLKRWLLALLLVSLCFWAGRTNWGRLYGLIPLHKDINVSRYICAIHSASIWLCALFLGWLARTVHTALTRIFSTYRPQRLAWVLFAGLWLVTACTFYQRQTYFYSQLKTFDARRGSYAATVAMLKDKLHARFLVHPTLFTGTHFHRDLLAALSQKPQLHSYGLTFHATLSTYYIEFIPFTAQAMDLYHIDALVARSSQIPAINKLAVWQRQQTSPYSLFWLDQHTSYIQPVTIPLCLEGDLRRLRPWVRRLMLPLYERGHVIELRRRGCHTPPRRNYTARLTAQNTLELWKGRQRLHTKADVSFLLTVFGSPSLPKGTTTQPSTQPVVQKRPQHKALLLSEEKSFNSYRATIQQAKHGMVMLKVNDFPYWTATVGGQKVPIYKVAPNFMAVEVPPGQHQIQFRYRNPRFQKLGFVVFVGFLWLGLLVTLWQRRPSTDTSTATHETSDPSQLG